MIVRVRFVTGKVFRVEIWEDTTIDEFLEKLLGRFVCEGKVSLERDMFDVYFGEQSIRELGGESMILKTLPLQNGDMFETRLSQAVSGIDTTKEDKYCIPLVDIELNNMEGTISRSRDPLYCKHGDHSMCTHCLPLEPYNAAFLDKNGIKHLSFHSYLRKINARDSNNEQSERDYINLVKSFLDREFVIQKDCANHLPYPRGLCNRCVPQSLLLKTQEFRMVDHVEFENSEMVDRFLKGWRDSGLQRFGYLYGSYEPYNNVPLGVKCIVKYIYEPIQEGAIDGFEIVYDNPHYEKLLGEIDKTSKLFGMERVGIVYTDLVVSEENREKVLCTRNKDTHFISCYEALFIAQQQLEHPYVIKGMGNKEDIKLGSRFVTVIISGNNENEIDLSSYQLSINTMKLVESNLISPSNDPSIVCVKQFDKDRPLPEIFCYKEVNGENSIDRFLERKNFPVDYLITSLTQGFPINQKFSFSLRKECSFQNLFMLAEGHVLSHVFLNGMANYIRDASLYTTEDFANMDWLVCVNSLEILKDYEVDLLRKAVSEKNVSYLEDFSNTEGWNTIKSLADMSASERVDNVWQCPHCTFINESTGSSCEVCGLPKS